LIKFNYLAKVKIRKVKLVKTFLEEGFKKEGKTTGSINYIFCNDEFLLQINKQFLNHDYFTDIITFDLSTAQITDAEIYISVDRVLENSKIFQVSLNRELVRVILHGFLHLVGYKDKTKSEIKEMRLKEEHYLRLFEKMINERL
jgi:probable rRNA maturation factor